MAKYIKTEDGYKESVDSIGRVQTCAETAQATAETAQATAETKMDANNPVGTGSFSMNRKEGSVIGDNSVAVGEGTVANFSDMFTLGKYNKYDTFYHKITKNVPPSGAAGMNAYASMAESYTVNPDNGMFTLVNPTKDKKVYEVPVGYYMMTLWSGGLSSGGITNNYGVMYRVLSNNTFEKYEVITPDGEQRGEYAHVVGNGTSDTNRSNAHTLDWEGNAWYQGDIYIGSTSGTNQDEGSKKLATEEYVDSKVGTGGDTANIDVSATVGQTIVVKEVDENGKPTAWEAVDYQQKVCGTGEVYFVKDAALEFAYDEESGMYVAFLQVVKEIIPGQSYKVTYNGILYESQCVDLYGMVVLGNLSFVGLGDDTGEPYVIVINDFGNMIASMEEVQTGTISILGEEAMTFDEKYLPEIPFIDLVSAGFDDITEMASSREYKSCPEFADFARRAYLRGCGRIMATAWDVRVDSDGRVRSATQDTREYPCTVRKETSGGYTAEIRVGHTLIELQYYSSDEEILIATYLCAEPTSFAGYPPVIG